MNLGSIEPSKITKDYLLMVYAHMQEYDASWWGEQIYEILLKVLSNSDLPLLAKQETQAVFLDIFIYFLNTLPSNYCFLLGCDEININGAKIIATALQKATIPIGFVLDTNNCYMQPKARQELVKVLVFNSDLCISGAPILDGINASNKLLSEFVQFHDMTKAKEVTQKIRLMIAEEKNGQGVLKFLKWLTRESTTDSFTSLEHYSQLAKITIEVLSNYRWVFKKKQDEVLAIIKNTWIEDNVVDLFKTDLPIEDSVIGNNIDATFHDSNDLMFWISAILKYDKKILKFYADHVPHSKVCEILNCIIFASNQEVKMQSPEHAIAHTELMQLVNILLPRSVYPKITTLSEEAYPNTTRAELHLTRVNQIQLSHVVGNEVKNNMLIQPPPGILAQVCIFSKPRPNEGLPEIERCALPPPSV